MICPKCGSENLNTYDYEHVDESNKNSLVIEHTCCEDCGIDFELIYKYVRIILREEEE